MYIVYFFFPAEIACDTEGFETLCELVIGTGLDEVLSDPEQTLTIFAPTNEAFSKVEGALATLTRNEAAFVLLYHAVGEVLFSTDLVCAPGEGSSVEMVNGLFTTTECSGSTGIFQTGTGNTVLNAPRIIAVDIEACNGVIHVVNNVILPGGAEPTPAPTYKTTLAPVYPTAAPTYKQTPAPVYPTPYPTYKKTPSPVAPTPYPTLKAVNPTPAPIKIDTLTATYTVIWGSTIEGCAYLSPNVFLNCEGGGVLHIVEVMNTICRQLSDDYVQCRQPNGSEDAFVQFTCSGLDKSQLLATAVIGPSPAWDCYKDGSAVKYITLTRLCYTDKGEIYSETSNCVEGAPSTQGGAEYCSSLALCYQNMCERLTLGGVTMKNTNDDSRCYRVDDSKDLQNNEFRPSNLSSLNIVDWRFSGRGRGCHWKPSSLYLRCKNGGELDFVEEYDFCRKIPEDNMAVCENYAPFSTKGEEVVGLLVSCTGKNEAQLILSVEIPSEPLEVACAPDAVALQSVMLGRACGEYESEEFRFINDPYFCHNVDQIFEIDPLRSYCFAGDSCTLPGGCSSLQLPSVSADTDEDVVGYCIYAV